MVSVKVSTFLKWPGGKRRLISQINAYLPEKIERYFEPFMGAASMFFYIKKKYNPRYCEISDVNQDLVDTFIAIRDNPSEVVKKLSYFKRNNSKEFYLKVRSRFNKKQINGLKRVAAFIYMNKTCFNGIYRVNSKNEFNVPYGRYENPEIFSKENILEASRLLQGVVIKCQSYEEILPNLRKGDFVYLDPCYDPLKKTSFANYTPKRFCDEDRMQLFSFMKNARFKGTTVMLSNNKIPIIHKMYSKEKFKVHEVFAARSVNRNADGRGKIPELLITT